jgi:WD40 repeat protein/HEAT repeat protein
MRHAVAFFSLITAASAALLCSAGEPQPAASPEEQVLRSAGLSTDGDALLDYFRERTRPPADLDKLLALARQLGDANTQTRSKAAAKLVATGPWAMPALRHVANELDNPLAAEEARRCLEWIAGPQSKEVPTAAAKLLAARKPAVAAATLLAFLPMADDQTVVTAVKSVLAGIAAKPGKADAALLAALQDPLPLRRAAAVEVLAGSGHAELLPVVHKLLADPMPQVRLRAALALVQRNDEKAVGVLIDLLADVPSDERLLAEKALQQLAGEWAPALAMQGEDALARKVRREAWLGWWRTMQGPALLAALRERASDTNEELEKLPSVLPRLLAVRKPAGATEALLAFLPFTDDQAMKEEIGKALKSLVLVDGQPDPAVLKALNDPLPVRRIAAAEALVGTGSAAHPLVRKLLTDGDLEVRLRVALALVHAQVKEAVPALIDLVAELPQGKAIEAEELLRRLGGIKAPPVPVGDDAAARAKLREAWQTWWKEHGAAVNMAQLEKAAPQKAVVVSSLTVVAELVGRGPKGKKLAKGAGVGVGTGDRLVAIERNGKPVWQIENLDHPSDFQVLPGERVLIAEYEARRVTERDLKGKILWEAPNLPGAPVNVQRLASGNTFIALESTAVGGAGGLLVELNPAGKTVASFNVGNAKQARVDGAIIAAFKMADGKMIYVTEGDQCVWLDATGKEIRRFGVPGAKTGVIASAQYIGNIDVTPKGHMVVVQNFGTIIEYDTDGKIVWQTQREGNRATRLSNGNTLIASLSEGVFELDMAGKAVWEHQPPAGYRAIRAREMSVSISIVRPEATFPVSPVIDPVLLAKKPSSADALKRSDIPQRLLALAGGGNAGKAPAELVWVFDAPDGNPANPAVNSLAISPDARWLAVFGDQTARLWDLKTGQPTFSLKGPDGESCNSATFSPDSALVAAKTATGKVALWSTTTGDLKRTLTGIMPGRGSQFAFSPDGKTLSAFGPDGKVKRWQVDTGQLLAGPWAVQADIDKVAFSPDGTLVAVMRKDNSVHFLDAKAGALVKKLAVPNTNAEVLFSADGKTFVWKSNSRYSQHQLWDVPTFHQIPAPPGSGPIIFGTPNGIAIHPIRRLVATTWSDDGTLRLWEIVQGQERMQTLLMEANGKVANRPLAFTPEGRYLAVAHYNGAVSLLRVPEAAPGTVPAKKVP